ncbi:MAG: hypothetical protein H6724_11115 [Sandaracinus sp.]|nr:hypothetical protein [Sandaracinus sp.]
MIVLAKTSWLRTLLLVRGTAVTNIWPRILAATAVAGGVTYAHEAYGMFTTNLTVTPFSLIGLALSIFLGFRNNTSYDRYWEGRKLWGGVVNTSRNLARKLLVHVGPDGLPEGYRTTAHPDAADAEIVAFHHRTVRRVVAYVHALRHHLRNQDRLPELEPFLPASELDALEHEQNRPLAILQRLSADLRAAYERGWIHAQHVPVVDGSIEQLIDLQGGCERIKATPIPFSYNVLLHRIVFVYCFTLPFGLVDIPGLNVFTPVVVALVSYAFFGLDAVGEEIEEPFGEDPNDLPLGAITRTIEINLRQRLGDAELPPAAKPVKNVLT